jgi:hypothetical protein
LDFGRLGARVTARPLTDPRDLFTALPAKAPGYGYLRDPQGQVLEDWFARRAERDLVIKMNTGAGKTITGLLILKSCLNEDAGPALYVVPTRYLADVFVPEQAAKLGLEVCGPESAAYRAGDEIAVVTIDKLINGRSVFGGPGSQRPVPVPIGSVVIDDAHAAIATTEAQSTVAIPRQHAAYDRLFALFRTDLQQQSDMAFRDIDAGDPSALITVPFWAWADHASDVGAVLHEYRDDDELRFTYPMVADILPICTAVVTSSTMEIRPTFPPVGSISSFAEAHRRIYLTATLPDDSVLVSHFDATPESVSRAITPPSAADLGDRMILAPQEINPTVKSDEVRQALRHLADRLNVVVLVGSRSKAEHWVNVADETAAADNIADVVERLKAGHVGLVVLINKYDGIDLPGSACEILVIDGLPESYGAIDRREAVLLGDSEAITGRQLQRIEQGMGRGVRSTDDHCVVILLGSALAQRIADPQNFARFSPATQAQLRLSRVMADALGGKDLDDMVAVMQQSIDRDPEWVRLSHEVLTGTTYETRAVAPEIVLARAAFDAAAIGQFDVAITEMRRSLDETLDQRQKGLRQEELARYQQQIDPAAAQQTLAGALRLNRRLTRPLQGVTYARLTPAGNQGQEAARFLAATYRDRNALIVGVNALLDDLVFDPTHTTEFEDAMEQLAAHLGFTAQRPERDTGNGPDVLWSTGGRNYLVIECKSGATSPSIWRHDVAQLSHSINWFDREYGGAFAHTPMLIHPDDELAADAVAPANARIVTAEKLGDLRDAVRALAVATADGGGWTRADVVGQQLRNNRLTAGDLVATFSVAPRPGRRPSR